MNEGSVDYDHTKELFTDPTEELRGKMILTRDTITMLVWLVIRSFAMSTNPITCLAPYVASMTLTNPVPAKP